MRTGLLRAREYKCNLHTLNFSLIRTTSYIYDDRCGNTVIKTVSKVDAMNERNLKVENFRIVGAKSAKPRVSLPESVFGNLAWVRV